MKKTEIVNKKERRFPKSFLTVLLSSMIWFSCSDFVDVVPENIAVIEDAFETRDSAEKFLATLYGYLPNFDGIQNPALIAGDEIAPNAAQSSEWDGIIIGRGGQSRVQPRLGYWGLGSVNNLFVALRDCNIFLANLDKPFDLTDSERVRWTAEAKFLKAYYHFYLLRMYGPIPIIDENLEVSAGVEAIQVPREPVDDVVNYIVSLLDEATPDLPQIIFDRGDELGRITSSASAALKARVLVTAASPLFNGNPDYAGFVGKDGNNLFSTAVDNDKWVKAAEACKEAIEIAEAAGHTLYTFNNPNITLSDRTLTKLSVRGSVSERWNDEIIWGASGSVVTSGNQRLYQARIVPNLAEAALQVVPSFWAPTLRIAEMFYSENGVPINEDVNYNFDSRYDLTFADESAINYVANGFETVGLHLNREPRFYASLGFDGGIWYGHGRQNEADALFPRAKRTEQAGKIDNLRFSLSGYFPKKLAHYENVQNAQTGNLSAQPYAFPVIRLADIYLLYAEALNETGDISQAQAWVDKVRDRAGLDGVVASWTNASSNPSKPSSQDGLREIIQQERMIELVFEGHRFWDLRRWKRAEEFMNSEIRGWNVDGVSAAEYYKVVTNGFYRFSTRDYLWPLNEADVVRNANLVQNPGW